MSARTNPFEMIERMFDQMSHQFDEAARAWESGDRTGRALESGDRMGRQLGMGTMGIDLADHGDEFVVTADVPGFEKDEIELRLMDDVLHLAATHEHTTEAEEETYLRSERTHRSLRERVRLPEPVQEDGIEASLKNGVLTVHLPKLEPTEEGGRRIDIE